MNANNQSTSFRTHVVNTKTIADIIDMFDEAKKQISILYANAQGYEFLQGELAAAYNAATDALCDMRTAQYENRLNK